MPYKRLPDAELSVMQAVWACRAAPVARGEIETILKKSHPMAPTTLLTLLSRLSEKGYLRIEKEGRSARYIPLVKKEDYLSRRADGFSTSSAAAASPPLPRPSAAAASPRRRSRSCAACWTRERYE